MKPDPHDVADAAAAYVQWCVENSRLVPLEHTLPRLSEDAGDRAQIFIAVNALVRRFMDGERLTSHRSGDAYEPLREPFVALFTALEPPPSLSDEAVARIREDYPEIVGKHTVIVEMPSTWLTTVRAMLSELRRIKLGQHGVGAAELTVRSLGPVVEARVLRPPVRSLKAVVHAPAARGATKQAIEAAVRHAAASTIATDQADLQHTYQLDIAAETAGYIRKCVDAGRILPASEVVTTFSADSDEVRYSMPKWVLARAYTLRKGADVEGIDPQTKTRFISLWKDLE